LWFNNTFSVFTDREKENNLPKESAMDGAFALPSDEERDFVLEDEESEAFDTSIDTERRQRLSMRDRLIRRLIEQEFLSFAYSYGMDALYLLQFESDPARVCERLRLYSRAGHIAAKIDRINVLLELRSGEKMVSDLKSSALLTYVAQARYDWLRGKIRHRANERHRREKAGTPDAEDLAWREIQKR
jgi:hypothetical protein